MRRTAAHVLVAVLALTGCSGTDEEPSPASSAVVTPGTVASTSPTPAEPVLEPTRTPGPVAPSDLTTPTATPCPAIGGLRDGSWEGPLTFTVTSDGDAEFDASTGTGTLRAVVAGGKVVAGTWTARWRATGRAETEQASATITLTGTMTGRLSGTASAPALSAAWRVRGTAEVTRPGRRTVPIDESGTSRARLTARSGCEEIVAAFRASFTSKEAQATFTGDATWQGRRAG